MPSPVIDDLDDLESLLVAMKFEMQFVIGSYLTGVENPLIVNGLSEKHPAVACIDDRTSVNGGWCGGWR